VAITRVCSPSTSARPTPPAADGPPPLRRRRARAASGLGAWLALSCAITGLARAATPPPFHAAHAAVASDNPLASAAGIAALRAGGNAVDAACATALALGVVHPDASGIGGGGFAIVTLADKRTKKTETHALDFRERAPAAISTALFVKDGKVVPELSKHGGLAVAVPGEVRGLAEMVKRWGKRPFGRCVDGAERLAARGFPVSWRLAKSLAAIDRKTPDADPRFMEIFAGKPAAEGDIWRRPDLAATLAKLRAGGPDVFYKGDVARQIVAAVQAAGGVLSAEDLAGYAPVERPPLVTSYRGLTVYSMPPSSSGGVVLVETLGILSAHYPSDADMEQDGRGSSAYLHVLAEALKHGFADRARYLGDADFVKVDVAHLTSPAYHQALARRIKTDRVLPADAYGTLGPPPALHRDGGTTHLCVIDAEGNAVALTTTVNLSFGAHLVAGKTGILLNDQIDDFSLEPGVPNAFGLIGSEQNAVAPHKRPLSSMTPTIATDAAGQVRIVVGGAGGPTIPSSTIEVLLNVVDWKLDAQAAVAAPRIHDQWFPDVLAVEPEVAPDVVRNLEVRGHKIKAFPHIGTVNVLVRSDKGIDAGAEPRSPSGAAGY
jgi:gamma-glutamyltranspeptidase / glutathione hydrolase